ncbi:hypothetical protein [Burkholderia singularis]|uniref:hypothetical protein n=1 Tax=Burkholderia singularis TaxID=1503053 RepID=UPI000F7747C1|nr:hypothetical protein [Burkholderia singularis]
MAKKKVESREMADALWQRVELPSSGAASLSRISSRGHSGFNHFRKLLIHYVKLECSFVTLNHLAAVGIAFRKVTPSDN